MVSKEEIIGVLRTVVDPELQIDIWTLELIRKIDVKDDLVSITMTFTTPLCPYGPVLVDDVKSSLRQLKGVEKVDVLVSFDPLWKPSEELKEMLKI